MTMATSRKFDWKLNGELVKFSIFTKKKCIEMIDATKIYGFIKNQMGISYQGIQRYKDMPHKTELEQIIKFKELYNQKLKVFQTAYKLSKHGWGRILPVNYLSNSVFHRPTRHTLCKDNYIDLDMVNCQPKIVSEICGHNRIQCFALNKYVENPKDFRKEIMEYHNVSKDVAKQLPITLMFGGTYEGWMKDNNVSKNDNRKMKEFVDIENEMSEVIEIVYKNNPKIEKDVRKQDANKWKTIREAKRGVMALWSQSVEKIIQEKCITYFLEKTDSDIEKVIPCQDGFMILKELYYPTLTDEMTEHIQNEMNITVNWIQKPFDEAIEIPSYEDVKTFDEWEDLLSVKCLADRFLQDYGENVVQTRTKDVMVFYGKFENEKIVNGRWYNETLKENRQKLIRYVSENLYQNVLKDIEDDVGLEDKALVTLKKILRSVTSKSSNMNDIIKHILTKVKVITEEFNSNPYLLGFENGVFDLKNHIFRDYTFYDYITLSTKYDYKPVDYSNQNNKDIRDNLLKIIEDIQPDEEHRKLYLQILASGLDGIPYQMLFLFNGKGGNGKGLTAKQMKHILGDYYCQPSNGIIKDIEKANAPSPDIYDLRYKRYVNFTEVDGTIRRAVLRNLTGGDELTGRLLHSNPVKIQPSWTALMEFNSSPELDGKPEVADYRRIIDVEFPTNYTDDENKIGKTVNGVTYKLGNRLYEKSEWILSIRDVFLDILLETYKKYKSKDNRIEFTIPSSVRNRTNEFLKNQDKFLEFFNNHYEISPICADDTKNDKIRKTHSVQNIWNVVSNDRDYVSLSYDMRRKHSRKEFHQWLRDKFKILTKKKQLVVEGIEYIETEELEISDDEEEATLSLPSEETKTQEMTDANGKKILLAKKVRQTYGGMEIK